MGDDSRAGKSHAQQRLDQISQQLDNGGGGDGGANTKRSRRRKPSNELPADWSDIYEQLKQLQTIARTPPTQHAGYIRQKQAGKLWVRERIEQLLDANTFQEIGSASGTVTWQQETASKDTITSFTPSNNVQGLGLIGGRTVCLTADDFSLRAGHADGATMSKTVYMEQLAISLRIPMVKLVDGSSGGGSVTSIASAGYSYVPPMPGFKEVAAQHELGIPNVAAILGPAIGLGAARAVACHFSVMAADVGALFNAGPAVVAKATFEEGLSAADLGGASIHCANGSVDNAAPNEAGCLAQLRSFLGYVPSCGHTALPPTLPPRRDDPPDRDASALRALVPRRRARAYAMRRVVEGIVDAGSFFAIGAGWGATGIVGLARLDGRPVGVLANNPEAASGAIDAAGAQKMLRHINLCDSFNLPLVQLVDCPGYAVGSAAEREATMKWGVELAKAYFASTVPVFSVVVRKCYGVAGGIMVDCREPRMRVAWPSLESGSLPLEGGVEASHSRELREAGDGRDALYTKLYDNYRRLQNPVRTAAAFGIEEIVDPADTRKLLCAWTKHMYDAVLPERLADRQSGKIRPVFR